MVSSFEKLNYKFLTWEKSVQGVQPGGVGFVRSYNVVAGTFSRFFISCSKNDTHSYVLKETVEYKIGDEPDAHVRLKDLEHRATLFAGDGAYLITVKPRPDVDRVTLKIFHEKTQLEIPLPK